MNIRFTSAFGKGSSAELEVPAGTTVETVLQQNGIVPDKTLIRLIAPGGATQTITAKNLDTPVPAGAHVTAAPNNGAGAVS